MEGEEVLVFQLDVMQTVYIEFDFRHLSDYLNTTMNFNTTFIYGTDWDVSTLHFTIKI
jgi:hypothetical protein